MASELQLRIGQRIKARREEQDLTQRELAELIPGKSDGNQVSGWERGEHRPSDATLEHIAFALEVDVSYFMAPEPSSEIPDVMGALGDGDRLRRIEHKLDELLDLLREGPEGDAADPAATSGMPRPPRPPGLPPSDEAPERTDDEDLGEGARREDAG